MSDNRDRGARGEPEVHAYSDDDRDNRDNQGQKTQDQRVAPNAKSERTLGEIFSDLTQNFSELVREEVALAKTELSQNASKLARDVVFLAIGGFIAYAGLLVLLAAAVLALAFLVPFWLSALIVGLVVVIIGYAFVQKGISDLRNGAFMPKQTVESLKEDREWAKEQLNER